MLRSSFFLSLAHVHEAVGNTTPGNSSIAHLFFDAPLGTFIFNFCPPNARCNLEAVSGRKFDQVELVVVPQHHQPILDIPVITFSQRTKDFFGELLILLRVNTTMYLRTSPLQPICIDILNIQTLVALPFLPHHVAHLCSKQL